jgi:DNA-directed RNA polymerase I subunit RPA1
MPKMLFVGIVERTCRATIIREIPGIRDCFQTKDDSKTGQEPEIKVSHHQLFFSDLPFLT